MLLSSGDDEDSESASSKNISGMRKLGRSSEFVVAISIHEAMEIFLSTVIRELMSGLITA